MCRKLHKNFRSGYPSRSIFSYTCHRRLSEHFSESQAAFRTTFGVTGGFLKARTSFVKRVTKRSFRISQKFPRSKQELYLNFLPKEAEKYCENHQLSYTKSIDLIFRTLEKIIISWHYPLKRQTLLSSCTPSRHRWRNADTVRNYRV